MATRYSVSAFALDAITALVLTGLAALAGCSSDAGGPAAPATNVGGDTNPPGSQTGGGQAPATNGGASSPSGSSGSASGSGSATGGKSRQQRCRAWNYFPTANVRCVR